MKKFLATTAIILMTTTGAFAQSTSGTKPVEELNRALDNYLATGANTDGIEETDMKPSRELIDKLNKAVDNSRTAMTNADCVEQPDQKPAQDVNEQQTNAADPAIDKCKDS